MREFYYICCFLLTFLDTSAQFDQDSIHVQSDTIKNSLLFTPVSSHTFKQIIRHQAFNKGLFSDPLQLIQGQTLGLWIVSPNGDPSQQLESYSSGFSSAAQNNRPLIVIDGIPNQVLTSINSQDIDSIVVLRDIAALRAYGSRGLNGVLLVSTRRSQKLGLHTNYTVQTAFETPARYQNLLSAEQWRYYAPLLSGGIEIYDGGANTDWQRQISRSGVSSNQLLTISGVLPKGSLSMAIGYLTRTGVILNTGVKRLTTRLDGKYNFWKNRIQFYGSGWYTKSEEKQMPPDLATTVQEANPTISSELKYFHYSSGPYFHNPQNVLDSVNRHMRAQYTGYRAALVATPIPNLMISLQHTFNHYDTEINTLDRRLSLATSDGFNSFPEEIKQQRRFVVGRINAGENDYNKNLITTDLAIQYKLAGKKSKLVAWGHYTTNKVSRSYFTYRRFDNGYSAHSSDSANPPISYNSWGGGLDYNFREKLFLALAYRQENYIESSLRLYGKEPAEFPLLSIKWQVMPTLYAEYAFAKAEPLHASAVQLEREQSFNLLTSLFLSGQFISKELFSQQIGRIGYQPNWGEITAEYLSSEKKTMFWSAISIPDGTPVGFSSYILRQQAVNLKIEGKLFSKPTMSLSSGLTAGVLKTQTLPMNNTLLNKLPESYSPYQWYYGIKISEVETGKFQQNGTRWINIGQPYPVLTLGWTTSFSWNRVSVNMLWRASFGGSISAPATSYLQRLSTQNWYKGIKIGKNDHLDNLVFFRNNQIDSETGYSYFALNNLMLQSTNHARLDNLAVSYRFQYASLPLQLQVFAQNVFTITSFPGGDPERSFYELDYGSSGAFYYKPRVLGLKLSVSWAK